MKSAAANGRYRIILFALAIPWLIILGISYSSLLAQQTNQASIQDSLLREAVHVLSYRYPSTFNIGELTRKLESPSENDPVIHTEQLLLLAKLLIAHSNTDLNKALDYGYRAIQKSSEKLPHYRISIFNDIANLYQKQGKFEMALTNYLETLDIGESFNIDLPYTLIDIGNIYFKQSIYPMAKEYYQQAETFFKEHNNDAGRALVLNNYALINREQQNYTLALAYVDSAISIRKKPDSYSGLVHSFMTKGSIYQKMGDLDRSKFYYQRSIQLSDSTGQLNLEAESIYELAKTERLDGQYNEALKLLDAAATLFKQTGNRLNLPDIYLEKARIHQIKEDLETALTLTDKSLNFAESNELILHKRRALEQLSDLHSRMGYHSEAVASLRAANTLRDSLFTSRLVQMQMAHELSRKEEKNQLLQNQNTIADLQLQNQRTWLVMLAGGLLSTLLLVGFIYRQNRRETRAKKAIERKNRVIEKQNREIRDQYGELQELNRTKDQLFSVIGHDLRAPIGNINQLLDVLITERDEMTLRDEETIILVIQKTVGSSYNMLENLLYWGREQQGFLQLEPKPCKLNPMLTNIEALMDIQAREKEIQFFVSLEEELYFNVDPQIMEAVLRNLISNAIKFTPPGGRIYIYTSESEDPDKRTIVVEDTGIGMDQEQLSNLFSLNGKVSRTGTHNERGVGLGLHLCKKFIEMHGSKLHVNSRVNKGSSFWFELPVSGKKEAVDNVEH